jgi:hypothetical protein
VVGPPGPDVVEDHLGAVDHEAEGRPARRGAADVEEHVLHRAGSAGFARPCPGWLPTCSCAGEFTGPAAKIIPDSFTPGTLFTRIETMP